MKKHVLRVIMVFFAIVACEPLFVNAQIVTTTPKPLLNTQPAGPQELAQILSSMTFTPKLVQLTAGGDPVVVKSNTATKLYNLSLHVIKDGQSVSGITVKTVSSRDLLTNGDISFQAEATATIAAGYQLAFAATLSDQRQIQAVIPSNTFSIDVIPNPNTVLLTRITPSSGERGSVARVEGNGFQSMSLLSVYFPGNTVGFTGDQLAQIIQTTNKSITLKIPPGAQSGKIVLEMGSGGTYAVRVTSDFIFTVKKPPTIESFSPAIGPAKTKVEILGYNFTSTSASPLVFKFSNDVTAWWSTCNQVEIRDRGPLLKATVIVPSGAVTGPLKVLTSEGTGISAQDFQVPPPLSTPPVITQFTPGVGIIGTTVTINGRNFGQYASGVDVRFGDYSYGASPSSCTNETIQVNVPSDATTGIIRVSTSGGTANSTAVFYLPPQIITVFPNSGSVGSAVSIYGKNIDYWGKVNVVKFNGIQAKVVSTLQNLDAMSAGGATLNVTVPTGATSGLITVETPGGKATSPQSFTVVQ